MLNKKNDKKTEDINLNNLEEDSISAVNIDKFKDLDGLTMKKLGFGLWYLENKKTLLLVLYIVLGTIGFFTWFSFFKTFATYIFVGMKEDQAIIDQMVSNPGINHDKVLQMTAQPILTRSAEVLLNSNGTYDVVAKIANVNQKFYSNFSYSFNLNNEVYGPFDDFILPGEEKFLILLNQKLSRRPGSVKLDIQNNWERVNAHLITDWNAFRDNYIDFSIKNKVFYNPNDSNLSEKLNLSTLEFDISNNSAYSYYLVDLDILLYYRGSLVSVNKYHVEKLISGETRHVNITWPGKVNRADVVEVIPNINIMSSDIVFIP